MSVSPIPVSTQAVTPIAASDIFLFGIGVSKGNPIAASPSSQNQPNTVSNLNEPSISFSQVFSSTVASVAPSVLNQSGSASNSAELQSTENGGQSVTESKLSGFHDLQPFLTTGKVIFPPSVWPAAFTSKHDKENAGGVQPGTVAGGSGPQHQPTSLSLSSTLPLFVWAPGVQITMPVAVSANTLGTESSANASSNAGGAGYPVSVSDGLAANKVSDATSASLDRVVPGSAALAFEIRLSQPGNQGPYSATPGPESSGQMNVTKDATGGGIVELGSNSPKMAVVPDSGFTDNASQGMALPSANNSRPLDSSQPLDRSQSVKNQIEAPFKSDAVGSAPSPVATPAASFQDAKAPAGIGVPLFDSPSLPGGHKLVFSAVDNGKTQNTISPGSTKPGPAVPPVSQLHISATDTSAAGQPASAYDSKNSASHNVTGNQGDLNSEFNVPAPVKGNKAGSGQEILQTPLDNPFGIHSSADRPAAGEPKVSSNSPSLPIEDHAPSSQPTSKPDLSVNMIGQSGETVNVRVSERGGEIQIAVRASDAITASQIRHELPAVQAVLERIGWHSEAASGVAQANAHHGDSQSESQGGRNQQGWRNNPDGQSRQDRRRSSGQDPWASLPGQDL